MSDTVEAPVTESAPAESAPQTTADIAAAVIARDDTPAEPAPAPTPEPEPELSEAAKFLIAQGHKFKTDDGKDVWLKAKTIEGMLDRYLASHRSTWDTERGSLSSERDSHAATLKQLRESLLAEDTDAHIRTIAQVNPRFARYLQQQQQQAQPATPDDFPQPDLPLPDGSATYTIKGLREQVFPWMLQQARAAAKAEAEAALKPLTEREQAAREHDARLTHVRGQMDTARGWDNWTDYEGDVLKKLQADSQAAAAAGKRPQMSLREAYLEVKAERLSADRNKVRGEVLEEMKTAPKGTSVSRGGAESVKEPGPLSTRDIARRVIERG